MNIWTPVLTMTGREWKLCKGFTKSYVGLTNAFPNQRNASGLSPKRVPSYGTTKPCQLIDLDISEERGPIPCRHWWFKGLGSSCSHLTELGRFGTFHLARLCFFWWFSHKMILTENFPFKQASKFQLDIISRKFPVAVMNTKVVVYHLNSSWFPTGGTLGRHCWHEKTLIFEGSKPWQVW